MRATAYCRASISAASRSRCAISPSERPPSSPGKRTFEARLAAGGFEAEESAEDGKLALASARTAPSAAETLPGGFRFELFCCNACSRFNSSLNPTPDKKASRVAVPTRLREAETDAHPPAATHSVIRMYYLESRSQRASCQQSPCAEVLSQKFRRSDRDLVRNVARYVALIHEYFSVAHQTFRYLPS